MDLHPYLNVGGNCEAAFLFYAEHLGGRATQLLTHGEHPCLPEPPPGWDAKVLYARLELGDSVLAGNDVAPDRFQPMRSAYASLTLDSSPEAERVDALFAAGGHVFVPMRETFFARRFAMLRDRFGVSWIKLHGR